jgi:alanine dehydrogenase
MSTQALVLGEADLRPLISVPSRMDSAIDAVEKATVDYHKGLVRERNLEDVTPGEAPNLVQIHFAADDALVTGFQMFAERRGGGPALPNSRFVTLLDRETRQLLAIVDYVCLSPVRVGASAGLGCRYLAPAGARVAGILGSSKQARTQLQAIQRSVPTLERARVYSPTADHREAFAKEVTEWLDLPVEAVDSAEEAAVGADIVGLANNSRQPVLEMDWVKAGALVISIGSNQLPPAVMEGPRVVSTTWQSLATREPHAAAVKAGHFGPDNVAAELGALIVDGATVHRDAGETVIFELSRINVWAVAVAHWAYEWAVRDGVGTPFTLSS